MHRKSHNMASGSCHGSAVKSHIPRQTTVCCNTLHNHHFVVNQSQDNDPQLWLKYYKERPLAVLAEKYSTSHTRSFHLK